MLRVVIIMMLHCSQTCIAYMKSWENTVKAIFSGAKFENRYQSAPASTIVVKRLLGRIE